MPGKIIISNQTRNNWWVDMTMFISGVIASLSGIYFLFLPVGGYQGGRNPTYGIQVLFDRHTWEELHDWTGLLMIAIALIHVPLHWSWIKNMFNKISIEIKGQESRLNTRGRLNLILNILVGASFLVAALSGLYFFFFPGANHPSGINDTRLIFSAHTWDIIHTWAGVIFMASAVLHFYIHWRWIVKVTGKMYKLLQSRFSPETAW